MNCKKCDRLQAEVDELWPYRKRAEKAEQERDEALAGVRVLARQNIECHERATAGCGHPNHGSQDHDCTPFLPVAESRPLTPDAITDEMVERALRAGKYAVTMTAHWTHMRDILTAALTEPPARPEGAEDIEAFLEAFFEGAGDVHVRDIDKGWLADQLAEVGLTEQES